MNPIFASAAAPHALHSSSAARRSGAALGTSALPAIGFAPLRLLPLFCSALAITACGGGGTSVGNVDDMGGGGHVIDGGGGSGGAGSDGTGGEGATNTGGTGAGGTGGGTSGGSTASGGTGGDSGFNPTLRGALSYSYALKGRGLTGNHRFSAEFPPVPERSFAPCQNMMELGDCRVLSLSATCTGPEPTKVDFISAGTLRGETDAGDFESSQIMTGSLQGRYSFEPNMDGLLPAGSDITITATGDEFPAFGLTGQVFAHANVIPLLPDTLTVDGFELDWNLPSAATGEALLHLWAGGDAGLYTEAYCRVSAADKKLEVPAGVLGRFEEHDGATLDFFWITTESLQQTSGPDPHRVDLELMVRVERGYRGF